MQQLGDRRFQEEQLSNYLLNKYKFQLLQPQQKSRFKTIQQGLEEYEKEIQLDYQSIVAKNNPAVELD